MTAMAQPAASLRVDLYKDSRATTLRLSGAIDETAQLVELGSRVDPPLVIDLGGVKLINSIGVRDWVRFLRAVVPRGPVTLRHCPVLMVNQFNLIRGAATGAHIDSFQAPYMCDGCGAEEIVELTPGRHLPKGSKSTPPDFPCPRCGGSLRFDEFPESYLLFLESAA